MKRALPWILLLLLVGFIGWKLRTAHFDWAGFARSLRTADWRLLLLSIALLYANNAVRALRWAVFLRPAYAAEPALRLTPWWGLIGAQFIGFTGLAIFGRLGELIRPLLVARRTGLTFASQVAVVTVERVFDLGAFALIFSLNLLLSPGLQRLPYHELFHKVGYAIAALTVMLVVFVASVRLAGAAVARTMGSVAGRFGPLVEEKILAFRDGLNVLRGGRDLLEAAGLSVVVWGVIAVGYVLVMKAFPAPVHGLSVPECLLLLGFSVVGGLVQLPGVGGGAQVGIIAALTLLFGIPTDLAVSAGLIVWLVSSMSVIPAGLVFAKLEGVSLRGLAGRSELAETHSSR